MKTVITVPCHNVYTSGQREMRMQQECNSVQGLIAIISYLYGSMLPVVQYNRSVALTIQCNTLEFDMGCSHSSLGAKLSASKYGED